MAGQLAGGFEPRSVGKKMSAERWPDSNDKEAVSLFERIEAGGSLITTACATRRLAHVLAACVNQRAAYGKTTAVVTETEGRRQQLGDLLAICEAGGEFSPRAFHRLGFLGALDNAGAEDENWFDRLSLVIVPCVEDSLKRPFEWEHLCYRIHDRCTRRGIRQPQFVLVISPRGKAEPALRRNYPVFDRNKDYVLGEHRPHEISFAGFRVKKLWWTFWAAEDQYLAKIILPNPGSDYGVEPVLAYFAGSKQVVPSAYRVDDSTAMEDQLEALQHRLTEMRKRPWNQLMSSTLDGYFVRAAEFGAEAVRDAAANPWRLLRAMAEDGGEALLASIVVPPSLLRGYLIGNPAYYAQAPLEPLTPRMLNSVSDSVAQIYLRLKQPGARIDLGEIDKIFERAGISQGGKGGDVFSELVSHFGDLFGRPLANRLRAESSVAWEKALEDESKGDFVRRIWVTLDSAQHATEVAWLDMLTLDGGGAASAESVRRDHAYQLYPPGQQCCVSGKLFRGVAIEHERVRIRHVAEPEIMTRTKRTVCLNDPASRLSLENHPPIIGSGFEYHCDVFELPFRIKTEGWWESADHGSQWRFFKCAYPERVYRPGRALRLVLNRSGGQPLLSAGQRLALVQWLNEAAFTLLPESERFFVAATDCAGEALADNKVATSILPRLEFIGETQAFDLAAIWIFEDSHADLGIIGACKERMEWILKLCLDYLVWRIEDLPQALGGQEAVPASLCSLNNARLANDFLTYGEKEYDPVFDFPGLYAAIQNCGMFPAVNSITSARRRAQEEAREDCPALAVSDDPAKQSCDFCGEELGVQGQSLNDGRHRCVKCSEVAVDNFEDADRIFNQVLKDFSLIFSRNIKVPVQIRFSNAHEIAAEQGVEFVPTHSFDPRAIGLAVQRSGNEYTILIEHGHSRYALAMTLVHELTHIWQYAWIDYERLETEHGKYLIEGHACWAELTYARYQAANCREPDQRLRWQEALSSSQSNLDGRSDEYGDGYRKLLQIIGLRSDAFSWLAKSYPKTV